MCIAWEGSQKIDIKAYSLLSEREEEIKHVKSKDGFAVIENYTPFALVEIEGNGRIEIKG